VPGDILKKNPSGLNFDDNSGDIWPEVSGIVLPATLSGGAERLAGIPCDDRVSTIPPFVSDECSQITPHRGRSEITGGTVVGRLSDTLNPLRSGAMFGRTGHSSSHHSGNERGLGIWLGFNIANSVEVRFSELQPHVEAARSGA
jgi:hypothetical protein